MFTLLALFYLSLVKADPDNQWINKHSGNCFTQHLREAMLVNETRGKTYSKLTHGKTNSISKELIFLDWIGTFASPYFDSRSKKTLSKNDLPLLCEVIPPFLPVLQQEIKLNAPIDLSEYRSFSVEKISRAIYSAHREGQLKKAQLEIQKIISDINQNTRFNCLTRQFLTSMDLLINVAHDSPSQGAQDLAWDSIRASLYQLRLLSQIDRSAAPFQAQGIPIICAEIPELPH
ncbi:MAG: hypothetical protein KA715_12625 [Xanthomonadaceae bacterium]|nr:hypothetical protein [Xanthomonadaceae bacterium]